MCQHKNLIYIGKQAENLKASRFLYLFNCTSCKTTVSMRSRKSRKAA